MVHALHVTVLPSSQLKTPLWRQLEMSLDVTVALDASRTSRPLIAQSQKMQSVALNDALLTTNAPLPKLEEKEVFAVAEHGADDETTNAGPLLDFNTQASSATAAAPPANTAAHGPDPVV
jgi:hypothetical protein